MVIEKEYRGTRKIEDFEEIKSQVEAYFSDWHHSTIRTSFTRLGDLYLKNGVCVAYMADYIGAECPVQSKVAVFRVIADEPEKIEQVRKDLSSIIETLEDGSGSIATLERMHRRGQK